MAYSPHIFVELVMVAQLAPQPSKACCLLRTRSGKRTLRHPLRLVSSSRIFGSPLSLIFRALGVISVRVD